MQATILILDDEFNTVEPLERRLQLDGYQIAIKNDIASAKQYVMEHPVDVAVVDVDLLPTNLIEKKKQQLVNAGQDPYLEEEKQGFRFSNWLQNKWPQIGILIYSAQKTDPRSKIDGLEFGADCYLIKTDPIEQVTAQIRALLRRLKPHLFNTFLFENIVLDCADEKLIGEDGVVERLTASELRLLNHFIELPHKNISRKKLYEIVNGSAMVFNGDRAIDTLVSKVRRKIQKVGGNADVLATARGRGYRFEADATSTRDHPSFLPD